MDRFLRKSKTSTVICVDTISLRLSDISQSTIVVRVVCCKSRSTFQVDGQVLHSLAWHPAFEIPLEDLKVDLNLKRTERWLPTRKLAHWSIKASEIISGEGGGTYEHSCRSSTSDDNSSIELTIKFSGIPSSSPALPPSANSASQQTTIIPDVPVTGASVASNPETLLGPEDMSAAVQLVHPVQAALVNAESLHGTLECLTEAAGYIRGIINLVKDFADIHPISKIAVDALIKAYDLVGMQAERDDSIKALAASMRDMLASLSEVRDLAKIELLRSVVAVAMTRVDECAQFINAYVQYGFWGRLVRQSLSSRTADTIQRFQTIFGELKAKFVSAISVQTLKVVIESHQVLRDDLANIRGVLDAWADQERLDKLRRSKRAAYDRGLQCLPGTRQDILDAIFNWIDSKEPGNNIFWLRGAAGSGKSTVASTVAACLDSEDSGFRRLGLGSLGATFFCNRDDDTLNQPSLIFPTMAFRLACTYPLLREGILSALKSDPDIGDSAVANQFRELLIKPLSKLSIDLDVPVIAILDAVDECGNEQTREPLLRCLTEARRLPTWFKLLITSRPENDIKKYLACVPEGHEVDTLDDQNILDVEAYTQHRLEALRTDRALGSQWPGEGKVEELISRAEGLFIWVSLSFQFMSQHPSPTEALDLVLTPSSSNHHHLDALYRTVLVQDIAGRQHSELVSTILGCLVVTKTSLSLSCICALLGIEPEKGRWARDKLASVLRVEDTGSVVRFIHPSFVDFLTNRERSNEFFIDVEEHHSNLALGCLRMMNTKLRANICGFTDQPTMLNEEIPNLQALVAEFVSDDLLYSCRYWTEHVKQVSNRDLLLSVLPDFLNDHVLHWLEVMSLTGETRTAILAIRSIQAWFPPDHPSAGLIHDIINFWATCGYAISQSAAHIYTIAAVFTPRESALRSSLKMGLLPKFTTPPDSLRDPGLLTLNGHTSSVTSIALSPDGTKIVSGSHDTTLRVWDIESGLCLLGPLVGHAASVESVAFSPDGAKIASGSNDNALRIWDSKSGLELSIGPLVGHTAGVLSVAFSSFDGRKIVSGSYDKNLFVWDAESGSRVLGPLVGHTAIVYSVAFSPDGSKIVSGSYDKTIRIWDGGSGQGILGPLGGHTAGIYSVAFSPDGTKIVSGALDKTVRVWDAETGSSVLAPLVGHTHWVNSVAFSPDGNRIVSGSFDNTIRVWDAESGMSLHSPLVGHTASVESVAFSPDGSKIVSGSFDSTLRVWDVRSALGTRSAFVGHTDAVKSVAFSPDGTKIASGSFDGTLRVWDATTGFGSVAPLVGHMGWISSVAFSPDGAKIVSGSEDKTLRVWDAESGECLLGPLAGHTHSITSVAFSSDGTKIASASFDNTVRIWDAESGSTLCAPLSGHTGWVYSVAFSPDSTVIVSGSYDKTIRVWDARSGMAIYDPLEGHTDSVQSVAFSRDGKRVVSGSHDRTVRIWDVESGSCVLGPLGGHTARINSVAFSPDGRKIASGSDDRTVRVWDADSGSSSVVGPLLGHTDSVQSIAFAPDGRHVVSGSSDKTLRLWDVESGLSVLGPVAGHVGRVTSAAFSADGSRIVSGSEDRTVRVWDGRSGLSVLGPLVGHMGGVSSVGFSPDGRKIVSCSVHERLVWDAQSGSQVECDHQDVSLAGISPPFGRPVLSDTGWIVDQLAGKRILWVPAHLRSSTAVAVHATSGRLAWFPSTGFPVVVTGLAFLSRC